jgi:hypothetical protein
VRRIGELVAGMALGVKNQLELFVGPRVRLQLINKAVAQSTDANLAAKCGLGPCHVGDLGWLHRLPEGKR